MKPLAWLALLLLAVPAPAAAELSPAERRINRTVEAEQARTIRCCSGWSTGIAALSTSKASPRSAR